MRSLRTRLVSGFILVALFLSLMMLLISTYAIRIVRRQVADSYGSMARLYLEQMDQELTAVEKHLALVVNYNKDIHVIRDSGSQNEVGKAKVSFMNQMQNDLGLYPRLDTLFLYIPESDTYLQVSVDSLPYYDKNHELPAAIREGINGDTLSYKSWFIYPHNGHFFMLRIVRMNKIYCGAWINMSEMSPPTSMVSLGENIHSFFTLEDGTILTRTTLFGDNAVIRQEDARQSVAVNGRRQEFQSVSCESGKAGFRLNLLIPEKNTLNHLPEIRAMSVILLAVTLFAVIPYAFFLISRSTLIPLGHLVEAMKKVKNGSLDTRIRRRANSSEFEIVYEVFNSMASRLQAASQSVQRDELRTGKEELYLLQKQYNPHFLINSLNMICGMIQTGEYASAEEMTRYLVSYFRFSRGGDFQFVLLRQETEHCESYLRIQQMRYRERLSYSIYMPDYLADVPVPPLVIQSFIENAIKYALLPDRPLMISVSADFMDAEDEKRIRILIQDNGNGFPETILHQTEESALDRADRQVGTHNVVRRLALLYHGKASLRLSNEDGAKVEIILPMEVGDSRYI